jgi:hypothetical protein
LGLWWSLGKLWPDAKRQVTYTAFLFVIFPLFTLQPIAVTFHQQWLQYVLYFLSLGTMVQAIRCHKYRALLTGVSLLFSALQLTITEYFIGLELLRPIILYFLIKDNQSKISSRLWITFKSWLPYFILTAAYIIWRLFFIELQTDDPYKAVVLYNFFSEPLSTIIHLRNTVIPDLVYMLSASWANVLLLDINDANLTTSMTYWLIALVSAIGMLCYFNRVNLVEPEDSKSQNNWCLQAAIIGSIAMILGILPAWITNRSVIDDFHASRYALPAIFGISLLLTAFFEWILDERLHKAVFLSLLISLTIPFHLKNAQQYSQLWKHQRNFYWQLSWRAPYLLPDTAVFSEEELFPNQGLFSMSSALNLLYPQPKNPETLDYWMYTLRPRFEDLDYKAEVPLNSKFRTLSFIGEAPDSIMVHYYPSQNHCVWILGPDDEDNPDLSSLELKWLHFSNTTRIVELQEAQDYPPSELFGEEPEHGWCYFYQKAELARQMKDWQRVVEIREAASAAGFHPTNPPSDVPHEWLPFIEAYAHVSDWEEAKNLTSHIVSLDEEYSPRLCNLWDRIETQTPTSVLKNKVIIEIESHLRCVN